MIEKHIIKILNVTDSSFTYMMVKKEVVNIDISIVSEQSFDAKVNIVMNADGGTANIRCLVLPKNGAAISLMTYQTHVGARTKSDLLVKTFIGDTSTFLFQGNVHIGKDAKKSDAYQKNINLLTGSGGVITTSPILEILNNDVRCTHGVTTGTIPEDTLWYMKTRGISETQAKALYVEGFIHDSMSVVQDKFIKEVIYNEP